jgi:hypothetical protein
MYMVRHHDPFIQGHVFSVGLHGNIPPGVLGNVAKAQILKEIQTLIGANGDEISGRCRIIPSLQADGVAMMFVGIVFGAHGAILSFRGRAVS